MLSMVEEAATLTARPAPQKHRVQPRPLHRLTAVLLPRGFATEEDDGAEASVRSQL